MINRLHDAVYAVAPNMCGVSVGSKADKATWSVRFSDGTTQAEKDAAQAVIASFDPDAPAVPASVKMWQAKAALSAVGKLELANAAIAAGGSDPLKLAWEYATDISRVSASVAAIAGVLGMTSAQVDALFISAAAIEV
jgi:hypothetical protein